MSKHLTDADVAEVRRYYGNHPGASLRQVAKVFNLGKSTVDRIIKTGQPMGQIKKRAHEGTEKDKTPSQRTPTEVVRTPSRTAPLIAGAQNEAAEIMRKLDELLQGQMSRLDEVLKAEVGFKADLKKKKLGPDQAYAAALALNNQHNTAIIGVKATLNQMANMQRNIQMYFDNRQVNINVQPTDEQWEMMWRAYIDPALRRAGVDKEKILKTAEIIEAQWEAKAKE